MVNISTLFLITKHSLTNKRKFSVITLMPVSDFVKTLAPLLETVCYSKQSNCTSLLFLAPQSNYPSVHLRVRMCFHLPVLLKTQMSGENLIVIIVIIILNKEICLE